MVVVDTDFVIDVMREADEAVSRLQGLLDGYRPVAVSAMTVMQLHHGIARSSKPSDERERVEASLDAILTYPLDSAVAARAGQIDGTLAGEGNPIGVGDTVIGATAVAHDEAVLTRNVEHFERIPGLEVETY